MEFAFLNPFALLLLLPCIAWLWFFLRSLKALPSYDRWTIFSLRTMIVLLLVAAIAQPEQRLTKDEENVIFVIDQSASVENQGNKMLKDISEIVEVKNENDQYGIVSLGQEAVVERSLQNNLSFGSDLSQVKQDVTNLSEGIQLASGLLTNQGGGRIVMLTDGNETAGDAVDAASIAQQQNITIDVMTYAPMTGPDASIALFETPATVYQGELANLQVTVDSTISGEASLRILKNNNVIANETVALDEGANAFQFSALTETAGTDVYKAEIQLPQDNVAENNVAYGVSTVEGPPRVLIVEGEPGNAVNVSSALQPINMGVDVIASSQFPMTLTSLLDYDALLMANVPGSSLSQEQMEMVETAVKEFGMGFIMTGGDQSFGLGGYFNTPIEKVLPVSMSLSGEKEIPSLGIVYVLDRSGSMSGYKLSIAKEAVARSIEMVREKDAVGLIAFDSAPWEVLPLQTLEDKEEAINQVGTLTSGGGTDIMPGLRMAYDRLRALDVQRKHIVLLTDGHSSSNAAYNSLLSDGLDNNITLSSVAIGDSADRRLLEGLAEIGEGRFYNVLDVSTIPTILSRETALTTRTYIVDDPFYPTFRSTGAYSNWFSNGAPQMNAYIATTAKGRASVILESAKADPILAQWSYGLGETVAWTSDLSGEWSGGWPTWSNWQPFWGDIITSTFRSNSTDPYYTQVNRIADEAKVTVTSESNTTTPLVSQVVSEEGDIVETTTRVTGPGSYEIRFPSQAGVYYLQLFEEGAEGKELVFQKGITVPFSEEFDLRTENKQLAQRVANAGGGQVIESLKDVFAPMENPPQQATEVGRWLILLVFFLFFMEIALRRFGFPVRLASTMQASFATKKDTESRSPQKGRVPNIREKSAQVAQNKNNKSTKTKGGKTVEESGERTDKDDRMKRLLDAKKRRQR
ncbi:VWA domain-containing protein [Aureibacillus halotolerans]|uniref:von Willebrand factor type A domain-containing protein n=1 Tax=Aureibacillus halotolerans TaxID=1508390 RepID=A0A4R6U1Y0_9BACI|nr:VWA domain-containing protein [Aureibacillus halotolerans]TDQ40340.1 von Willebrand factor type A domain-containing protein [Aureibacillus halotolerans]